MEFSVVQGDIAAESADARFIAYGDDEYETVARVADDVRDKRLGGSV